jgi:organic radical activating enzyme
MQLPLHLLLARGGCRHARRQDILSFEEIVRLVACFTRLGVRRLRLTGGEPTVRRDLPALVEMLRGWSRHRRSGAVDERAPCWRDWRRRCAAPASIG